MNEHLAGVGLGLAGLHPAGGAQADHDPDTQKLIADLARWQNEAAPGEDRAEAVRRVRHCWDEWDEHLDLSHLGLTRLPDCIGDLDHLCQLHVSGNALDHVPEAIEELQQLRVFDLSANRFQDVPDALLALPAGCAVCMADNNITMLQLVLFQDLSDERLGPLLSLERGAMVQDAWQQPDLDQSVSLPQALSQWRAELGSLAEREPWHGSDHPHVSHFGGWLVRLRATPDFAHPSQRRVLIERVRALLTAMNEDPLFRETCLHVAHEAGATCDDNVALGLNRLEMALHNRRAERGELPERALFELGRGMFRLDRLTAIAEEKFAALARSHPAPDQVDVHLAYQAGLRETLQLPVSTVEMRFRGLSGVSVGDLKHAAESIRRMEARPPAVCLRRYQAIIASLENGEIGGAQEARFHPLARYLAESWLPWQQHVARSHQEEAGRHAERMFAFVDRIEAAREADEMNEGDYLASMNAAKFYANHGLPYQKALEMMAA